MTDQSRDPVSDAMNKAAADRMRRELFPRTTYVLMAVTHSAAEDVTPAHVGAQLLDATEPRILQQTLCDEPGVTVVDAYELPDHVVPGEEPRDILREIFIHSSGRR